MELQFTQVEFMYLDSVFSCDNCIGNWFSIVGIEGMTIVLGLSVSRYGINHCSYTSILLLSSIENRHNICYQVASY